MDAEGLQRGSITEMVELKGGTQNVLVRFERAGRSYVLRRGPRHLRPGSNDVMRREMRLLGALGTTTVLHPRLIAACSDETVLGGAAFYLMEAVDGFNPTAAAPEPHASSRETRHEMALQALDALIELGRVDHIAVGLGDFGRPDGFLERQVARWNSELESYQRFDGYPGHGYPGLEGIAAWLDANRPSASMAGIMHGDYHFGNLLYDWAGPSLLAIVDWEMCTIGDPLLDLGWLIATSPGPDGDVLGARRALTALGEFAPAAELVARYAAASPRDCSEVAFYVVLACYKLGIVLEGTYARSCAGKASPKTGANLHGVAHRLFARAERVIDGTFAL